MAADGEVVVTSPDKDVMIPIEVICDGEKPRYGVVEDGLWKRPYKVGANLRVRNLAEGGVARVTFQTNLAMPRAIIVLSARTGRQG